MFFLVTPHALKRDKIIDRVGVEVPICIFEVTWCVDIQNYLYFHLIGKFQILRIRCY